MTMIHVYINPVMVGKFLSGKLKFMCLCVCVVFAGLTSIATSSCFWILEFTAYRSNSRKRDVK